MPTLQWGPYLDCLTWRDPVRTCNYLHDNAVLKSNESLPMRGRKKQSPSLVNNSDNYSAEDNFTAVASIKDYSHQLKGITKSRVASVGRKFFHIGIHHLGKFSFPTEKSTSRPVRGSMYWPLWSNQVKKRKQVILSMNISRLTWMHRTVLLKCWKCEPWKRKRDMQRNTMRSTPSSNLLEAHFDDECWYYIDLIKGLESLGSTSVTEWYSWLVIPIQMSIVLTNSTPKTNIQHIHW